MAATSNPRHAGIDRKLRLHVYKHIIETGQTPKVAQIAKDLCRPVTEIRAALRRLSAGHAVVLEESSGEILRAAPFWAVPTSFRVECGTQSWWGSCIWDALGIPVMLKRDADIITSCGCCSSRTTLEIRSGSLVKSTDVIHFAVPVRRWYENVVFT
jgi:hypothetical protein